MTKAKYFITLNHFYFVGYEKCVEKSLIHWTAEVCIADPDDEQALAKSMSAVTQVCAPSFSKKSVNYLSPILILQ